MGAFLLFVSSIFLLITVPYALQARRFSHEARQAAGTVVKKEMQEADQSSNSSTRYKVDYSFTTVDGRKIEGNETVDADVWDHLKEGGPIQIEYVASAPRINRMLGDSYATEVVVGAVAAPIWLIAAVLTLTGWRSRSSGSGKPANTEHGERKSKQASSDRPASLPAASASFLRTAIGLWTVFGTVLLLVGAVFLLISGLLLSTEHAYHREGKTATAIVLTKRSHQEYNYNNDTREAHYQIGYRFNTDDGRIIRSSEEVKWRRWRSIHERDPIQIVYLPRHPSTNRLAAENPTVWLWLVAVLGTLLICGGAVSFVYGLVDAAHKYRGLRKHTLFEAVVTKIEEAPARRSGQRWEVHYQYRDQFGQTRDGMTVVSDCDEINPGTEGYVRLDPGSQSGSIWTGRRRVQRQNP